MTKNTDTISTQKAASAGGKAALSGADILQAAQYDANGKAGLPTLRSAFPQYRELTEVLQEIAASPEMTGAFRSLTPSRRQEFLDFCCGNRGVRVLYDSYFKYVFDPDVEAAALSRMISVLIGLDVKLVQILPNESHLGADYTLVIMDIIVEASDGSIVNVEVQKIGYNFPGERAACYNADLLLRQYQRIRKEFSENDSPQEGDGNREKDREGKKGTFSYKYIRPVYTIVFMETSTKEFHRFRQDYIHTFAPVSDTGLKLNLLQNYIFVPLDIFRSHLDALLRPAGGQPMTEKEAWLAFLSSDDPRVILRILEDYPGIDLHNVPKHEGDDAHVLRRTLHPGQKYGYDDDRRAAGNHRTTEAGAVASKTGTVTERQNHWPTEAGAFTAETGNRVSPQGAGESPAEKIKPVSS